MNAIVNFLINIVGEVNQSTTGSQLNRFLLTYHQGNVGSLTCQCGLNKGSANIGNHIEFNRNSCFNREVGGYKIANNLSLVTSGCNPYVNGSLITVAHVTHTAVIIYK